MLRSENGRPVTWIYVDGRGSDMQTMVGDIQRAIAIKVPPPASASPILVSTSCQGAMKLVIPDAGDHSGAAVPDIPPLGRGAADLRDPASPYGRAVAALLARLQPVGRHCGWVHCAFRGWRLNSAWSC
jgi:hypothetical protein